MIGIRELGDGRRREKKERTTGEGEERRVKGI